MLTSVFIFYAHQSQYSAAALSAREAQNSNLHTHKPKT